MVATLVNAYTAWRNEPFPPGSQRDDIDELHADVATIDTWVADVVIPYVEAGRLFPVKVDVAASIVRSRARAMELLSNAGEADRDLLTRYIAYLDLLNGVFAAYQEDAAQQLG